MKIAALSPGVVAKVQFSWAENKFVPVAPGCYAIATYDLAILYVGLATKSIRARMAAHLESGEKRKGASGGAPFWLYYLECPATDVHGIERGWINQAILEDGSLPPLNRVHSPV